MKRPNFNRRKFLKYAAAASGIGLFGSMTQKTFASSKTASNIGKFFDEPRIRFSVFGINHAHIFSQVDAAVRGARYGKERVELRDLIEAVDRIKAARVAVESHEVRK